MRVDRFNRFGVNLALSVSVLFPVVASGQSSGQSTPQPINKLTAPAIPKQETITTQGAGSAIRTVTIELDNTGVGAWSNVNARRPPKVSNLKDPGNFRLSFSNIASTRTTKVTLPPVPVKATLVERSVLNSRLLLNAALLTAQDTISLTPTYSPDYSLAQLAQRAMASLREIDTQLTKIITTVQNPNPPGAVVTTEEFKYLGTGCPRNDSVHQRDSVR